MKLYLGIDTSCYTTSLALVDGEGNLFSQARKLLTVPQGGRGLAQNEALFQHIVNLPELFEELLKGHNGRLDIAGIAASTRPRPVEGSYMPVFRAAESFGRSIGSLFKVPFFETTHQEGHIMAGSWSGQGPQSDDFLAIHVSGGTTEILRVRQNISARECYYTIDILGGGSDLHAGQFVDRVGVALGLPFPSGPHLEKMAREASGRLTLPSSVKEYSISFSGPAAAAERLIRKGEPAKEICRAVEKCITNSVAKVIQKAVLETGLKDMLVVGGVAANHFIKENLISKNQREPGVKLYFADTALSSDNAVGVALIGMHVLKGDSS